MGRALLGFTNSDTTVTGFAAAGCASESYWYLTPTRPTEAEIQVVCAVPGTVSKIGWTYRNGAWITGAFFRKNGADTALTVAGPHVSGGELWETAYADAGINIALAENDNFCFRSSSNTSGFSFQWIRSLFEADTGHACYYTLANPSGQQKLKGSASSTFYFSCAGLPTYGVAPVTPTGTFSEAIEDDVAFRARVAGTLKGCQLHVKVNTRTTNTVFHLRINGADSGISITYAAGETGRKLAAGTTEAAIADGDYFCWSHVNGASSTGNIQLTLASCVIVNALTHKNDIFTFGGRETTRTAGSASSFVSLFGTLILPSADSEDLKRISHGFNGISSRMRCYVKTNTAAQSTFVYYRINGLRKTQVIEIPAGETGFFEDTTHTDAFGCEDFCNYEIAGTGTGAVTFKWFGSTEEDTLVPCDDEEAPPEPEPDAPTGLPANDTSDDGYRQLLTFPEPPFNEYVAVRAQSVFPVTFRVFDQDNLRVTVDHVELPQDDFTFEGFEYSGPGYDGGVLTLDDEIEGATIRIWADPAPARIADFLPGEVTPTAFNEELEKLWQRERAFDMLMKRGYILAHSSAHTLIAAESGAMLYGPGPYTLPAASAGLQYHFFVPSSAGNSVLRAGSDKIVDGGTESNSLASTAAGSLLSIINPIGAKWYVRKRRGTWS